MKRIFNLVILFTTFFTTLSCSNLEETVNFNSELNDKESLKTEVGQKIFTISDFEHYAKDRNSVVSKLSKSTLKEFIINLEYSKNGLISSVKYDIIEQVLCKEDAEKFWILFGINKIYYKRDYKCQEHNCVPAEGWLCLCE